LADAIERDGVASFVDRWERLPLWASQEALPASARARLRAQRLTNVATGLANSLRGAGAGVEPPVLDRLGMQRAPALLVAGALDARYVAHARAMAAAMHDARVEVVREAGHAVHLERPDELGAIVRRFLSGVASKGTRWIDASDGSVTAGTAR
jgi:2-succinyl-5-enolpyruvyl-6-hydroxy-3-cyclohexene-1-carboxylate synthase/2-succinyl-6-hydroxy-2,4-cyclohexadiene-1-carboxylate synthase